MSKQGFKGRNMHAVLVASVLGAALTVGVFYGGCKQQEREADAIKQEKIRLYIQKWLPFLNTHDFPSIFLKPRHTEAGWKIVVGGIVTSPSEADMRDTKIILPAWLAATEPPTDFIWEVEYRLVPPKP